MSTYPFRMFYVVLGVAAISIVVLCACTAFSTVGLLYGIRNGAQVSCPNKFSVTSFADAVKDHILVNLKTNKTLTLRSRSNITYTQDVTVEATGDSFCVSNQSLWDIYNFVYNTGYGNGDQFARNELKTGK